MPSDLSRDAVFRQPATACHVVYGRAPDEAAPDTPRGAGSWDVGVSVMRPRADSPAPVKQEVKQGKEEATPVLRADEVRGRVVGGARPRRVALP